MRNSKGHFVDGKTVAPKKGVVKAESVFSPIEHEIVLAEFEIQRLKLFVDQQSKSLKKVLVEYEDKKEVELETQISMLSLDIMEAKRDIVIFREKRDKKLAEIKNGQLTLGLPAAGKQIM